MGVHKESAPEHVCPGATWSLHTGELADTEGEPSASPWALARKQQADQPLSLLQLYTILVYMSIPIRPDLFWEEAALFPSVPDGVF